jgi:hypothetical protein
MSPRYSSIRSDRIEYSLWLVFDDTGGVRMTRAAPNLCREERAVALTCTLPKSLFRTPTLRATMTIDDAGAGALAIDVEAANVAIKQALGVDIDLRLNPPTNGETL